MRPAVSSPAVESARVACTCAWRRPRGHQAHSKKILLFHDLFLKVLQTLHVIMLSSPAKPAGTSTISEADLPLQTIAAHLEVFEVHQQSEKNTVEVKPFSAAHCHESLVCLCTVREASGSPPPPPPPPSISRSLTTPPPPSCPRRPPSPTGPLRSPCSSPWWREFYVYTLQWC